jgi:hypothetical protein
VRSEFEIINGQNQYLSIGQKTSSGTPVNILSCWPSRAVVTRNDYNLNAFNIVISNFGNLGWNPAAIYFLNQKATYPLADTGFAILYTQANGMVEPIAFHGDGNNLHDYVSTPGAQSQLSLTFTKNPDLTWKMTANGVEFNMPAGYLADLNPSNIYVSLGMWVGDPNASASYSISRMSLPNASSGSGAPSVNGVNDNGIYQEATITFSEGSGLLNGNVFLSGTTIKATGLYSLIVTNNSQNSTTVNFKIVHFGDVNGDEDIDVVDLTIIKNHLLKINLLSGVFEEAADVNSKGYVSISDLLTVKKYILGVASIIY